MYAHASWIGNDSTRAAIGGRVRITYTNAGGESSIRVVEPERIYRGRNGITYLRAFCHLRGEERTFRFDRIGSWEPTGAEPARDAPAAAAPAPLLPRRPPGPVTVASPPSSGPVTAASPAPEESPSQPARRSHVPPRAGPCRASAVPQPARKRHPWRVLLVLGGIAAAGRLIVAAGTANEARIPSTPPLAPPAAATSPERPEPHAAQPQPTPPRRLSYRGVEILATGSGQGSGYSAPDYGLAAGSLRGLHLQINALLFRRATAIAEPALERLYADADRDRDGYLCWEEIRGFQRSLTRRYRYLRNTTALRPDQFLSQGGGDCEDWALVTCGLLRYWGWESYVGAFFPPDGGDGHALCLVRWAEPPRGFDCLRVAGGVSTWDGKAVRPGYYVPVDYELVGGTSNAVRPGWRLKCFYTPEAIYGLQM